MEIRIRNADDTESRLLADIPFRKDVIDAVIPTIASWGIVDSIGRTWQQEEMTGQFVDNGTKAYFEVILGADE